MDTTGTNRLKMFKIPREILGLDFDGPEYTAWFVKMRKEGWKFFQRDKEYCLLEAIEA